MNRRERRRQTSLSKHTQPGQVPSSDLRLGNLAAFNEFLPGLFHELAAYKPRGRLVEVEGGDHDVELEGNRLYGGQGAQKFARQQLDAYWSQPKRVTMGAVDSVSLDAHSNLFGAQLVTRASDSGMTFRVNFVAEQSYFLVVLGVGLAHHVAELAHRTGCHYLILVEPDLEYLYHSTFVFDWRALLAEFSGDKTLEIVVSDNAEDISNIVQHAVLNANTFAIEGMYWFDHYQNESFSGAFADFLENRRPPLAGFFTDEFYMISQSHGNLRDGTSRVVASKYDATTAPAFIVGTGPSLDAVLPVLKDNQDDAVIMACGTALEPLLIHGIRPDFLVHLERDEIILDNHRIFSRDYDFSDVCLIAASNLYPGITDFHDSTVFFFRPVLSSRPLFAREAHQVLSQPDPLVANSALAFAHRAGFRNIYFFGVDMGTKDAERFPFKGLGVCNTRDGKPLQLRNRGARKFRRHGRRRLLPDEVEEMGGAVDHGPRCWLPALQLQRRRPHRRRRAQGPVDGVLAQARGQASPGETDHRVLAGLRKGGIRRRVA